MNKLAIGIVGVGSISRMHIQSYQKNNNCQVVAFCDLSAERLAEKSKLYNVESCYTDYNEMFRNEKLDCISICTWNAYHAEIAVEALKAGINVLCEKPLTITNKQAEAVAKAQAESGKHLMVGFVRRHATNTKIINKFINSGDLGEIYYSRLNCFRRLGNPGGWFSDITRSGGGPLIDLGVHLIDVAWYLMGKPKPVSVSANTYNCLGNFSNIENKSCYKAADYSAENNSVEDLANALIRFENGASMFIDVSYSLHTEKDRISAELFGSKGGAILEPSCKLFTQKHNNLIDITPYIDDYTFNFDASFQSEIDSFINVCLGAEENICPVQDGVTIMQILNAVYKSAELNKEIYF